MKKTISLLLLAALCLSLCACGDSGSRAASEAKSADEAYYSANGSYIATEEAWAAEEPEMEFAYDSDYGLAPVPAPQSAKGEESTPTERPDKII